MLKYCDKPLIFPLSNPSSKAEITADKAYEYAHGKCVYASGAISCLLTCSSLPEMQLSRGAALMQADSQRAIIRMSLLHPLVRAHLWRALILYQVLGKGQGASHSNHANGGQVMMVGAVMGE